ncbi:MAG: hypothetical protein A2W36_05690 [Chloroflexi bacterium RBG_16_58_14]|nr:MAG: hypothetical protein A2W36_05690 [Chloroflexi bacterium RBG_16_58_14]
MLDFNTLKSLRYVVDQNGRKSAVQVDLATWSALLGYLEDLEDRAVLKDKLVRLKHDPAAAGAIAWDEAKGEW